MPHESEPSFNPVDVRLPDEEQVFAGRWELLRRNKQFEFAQAMAVLNGRGMLLEAARHFSMSRAGEIIPMRTLDLVADLIKAREANHASIRASDAGSSRAGALSSF
jgi:hypothetical protein